MRTTCDEREALASGTSTYSSETKTSIAGEEGEAEGQNQLDATSDQEKPDGSVSDMNCWQPQLDLDDRLEIGKWAMNPAEWAPIVQRLVRRHLPPKQWVRSEGRGSRLVVRPPLDETDEYQIAWHALLNAVATFDEQCTFEAYLYNQMRWAILNYYRSEARFLSRTRQLRRSDEPAGKEPDPTAELQYRELNAKVAEELSKEQETSGRIAWQRLIEQLAIKEIAQREGLSHSATRKRASRVRDGLRRKLKSWVG